MIGRQKELEILRECATADRSRLVVVYGRRRVGKTFLIREAFDYRFTFTHTGLEKSGLKEQLFAFAESLREQWKEDVPTPKNWMEAFSLLKKAIVASTEARKIVFLDELPWMDTPRSGFISAVENFWNGWASARKDVVLIVCGSAAAWMTKKVLQNQGGLFNRASLTIYLEPFTLKECEEFVRSLDVAMDRKDIVLAYMIFGGAAYYWSLLDRRQSLSQNIDRLFFIPGAELAKEYRRLYRSVFDRPEPYMAVVSALAKKKIGMTREELAEVVPGIGNNGTLTEILENLEISGFVRRYSSSPGRKKGSIFQLIDNYTLFYFKFVDGYDGRDRDHWMHLVNDPGRRAWEGLAFERVCLLHSDYIKKALGVSGVATTEFEWRDTGDGADLKGSQIDLVIERSDRVTNLCEMKFTDAKFEISSEYAERLRERRARYRAVTGTRHACQITMVSSYGVQPGRYSSVVQAEVTMDDLFKE